jgi:hypothetical protein
MPTHETGKEWTAEVLKEWLVSKNRDLREHEGEAEVGAGVRGRRRRPQWGLSRRIGS